MTGTARNRIAVAAVTLLAATTSSAETLRDYLEAERKRAKAPSLSVAVGVGDRLVAAEAVGLADVENTIPASAETQYRIYSVTKAMTAVALLQQRDRGLLRLDDEIRSHLPAFPSQRPPITLRQLALHTSGIRHVRDEDRSRTEYRSIEEALATFADDSLRFPPGTQYLYSSLGFNLLAAAIEHAAARPFAETLRVDLFEPAALTRTLVHTLDSSPAELARPYRLSGWYFLERVRRLKELPNLSGLTASAGVVSTPSDLVRFVQALSDGQLLARESLREMWSVAEASHHSERTIGWFRSVDDAGRPFIYASGRGVGYTGLVIHYPDEAVTGALLSNLADLENREEILSGAIALYLDGAPR